MLVLSRMKNEVIMIGDAVRLVIVDLRGDKVKIGIDAPSAIVVDRLEVWEAKQREKQVGTGTITPESGLGILPFYSQELGEEFTEDGES